MGTGWEHGRNSGERGTSYAFSRYPLIWGWATWRRAWERHDPALPEWPALREAGWLEGLLGDPHAAAYWAHRFDEVHAGGGSWDVAWLHTCWRHGSLTALPTTNLVSNLGFRDDATHTGGDTASPFAAMPTAPMAFPLTHPAIERDAAADDFIEDAMFSGNLRRAFGRLREHTRRLDAGLR